MRRWLIVVGVVAGLAFAVPVPAGAGERTVTLAMYRVKTTYTEPRCTSWYDTCGFTETRKALGGDDGAVPRRWSYSSEGTSSRAGRFATFEFTAPDGDTLVGSYIGYSGGYDVYEVTGGTGSYAGCTSPRTPTVGSDLAGGLPPILRLELTC
jgi:hypothetical protein